MYFVVKLQVCYVRTYAEVLLLELIAAVLYVHVASVILNMYCTLAEDCSSVQWRLCSVQWS